MLKKDNGRRKQVASEWWAGQPLSFPSKVEGTGATASRSKKTKLRAKDKRK